MALPFPYIRKPEAIEFDPAKSERNDHERGVPFSWAESFEFRTAIGRLDARFKYGETRWIAYGLIGERVFALAYTWRGERLRVISLRKANAREVAYYERNRR